MKFLVEEGEHFSIVNGVRIHNYVLKRAFSSCFYHTEGSIGVYETNESWGRFLKKVLLFGAIVYIDGWMWSLDGERV